MRSMWLGLASAFLLAMSPAQAQDGYPSKQVTVIVPFAAGGTADIFARMVSNHLQMKLGKPFVVENVGGAGSILGVTRLAKSAPDGITIGLASTSALAINPSLYGPKLSYQPDRDLAPVAQISVVPNVLVVNPELPAKDVAELLALLKAKPDEYSYASSGNGTPLHLSGELFKKMAGVSMQHIPYKGAGPALNDVIGNQVPIMFDNLPSSSSHIKAGTLRALAVTTAERAPSFPDVPTVAEAGIPGYETYTWNALFAPANTPQPVVARLNEAANKALKDPAVVERMKEFSATIVGSTPEELEAHVKAELAKWTPVVRDANVQMD